MDYYFTHARIERFELSAGSITMYAAAGILVLCVLTRLYTGISQTLKASSSSHSTTPPIDPYWIPFIGHGFGMMKSMDTVLTLARSRNKSGVYGLHMFGNQHYMVQYPSVASECFRQRSTVLTLDDFMYYFCDKVMGDQGTTRKVNLSDMHAVHGTLNTMVREPVMGTMVKQLQSFTEQSICNIFSGLDKNIAITSDDNEKDSKRSACHVWELNAAVTYPSIDTAEAYSYQLFQDFTGALALPALMGSAFLQNYPDAVHDLLTFDNGFSWLITGLPGITSRIRKVKAARARLLDAVKDWANAIDAKLNGDTVPEKWGAMDDVSGVMTARQKAFTKIKAPIQCSSSQHLGIMWAMLTNANKVAWWLLIHILADPKLLATVRKETADFVSYNHTDGRSEQVHFDAEGIWRNCPILKAATFETFRMYTPGISYKKVLQDLTLSESQADAERFGKKLPSTYTIKKGTYLALSNSSLQADQRIWHDPKQFDYKRFLSDSQDDAHAKRPQVTYSDLFPWGGGVNMCKGRNVAEREVMLFAMAFLTVYDMELCDGSGHIPEPEADTVSTRMPLKDVRMRFKKRRI